MRSFQTVVALITFLLGCWISPSWADQKRTAQVLVPEGTQNTPEQFLARSLVSAGLVDAGYRIIDSNSTGERPAELGAPADLQVLVTLAVQKNFSAKDQAIYLLSLRASETALGRVVGACSKTSKPFALADKKRGLSLLHQLVIKCRTETLSQAAQMKGHEAKTGQSFALNFMNVPKGAAVRLKGVLKKMCQRVKLVSMQGSNPRFKVSCKTSLDQLQQGIEQGIQAKLDGAQFQAQKMGNVGLMFIFQQ